MADALLVIVFVASCIVGFTAGWYAPDMLAHLRRKVRP